MNTKFFSAVAALAIGFSGEAAFADDAAAPAAPTPEFTITGAASIVSQYKFRGLTQSDSKPAVQATFTVSDKSGFYITMWGSSGAGNRGLNADGTIATVTDFYISPNNGTEIDIYGGYTHALGKTGITIDGGLYGYIYPNLSANNLFEVYGDLSKSYGPITVKVGLNWAPKQHYFNQFPGITHYNMYEYGELGYTPTKLPALNFHGHLGHTGGGLDFVKQYIDYTAGVGYKWKALTFDISAVGTNISKKDSISAAAQASFGVGSGRSVYRYGKIAPVASITASF